MLTEENINNLIAHMDTLWRDIVKIHEPLDMSTDEVRYFISSGAISPEEGNNLLEYLAIAKEQVRRCVEFNAFLRKAVMEKSDKYKDTV